MALRIVRWTMVQLAAQLVAVFLLCSQVVFAAEPEVDNYRLAAGDAIRVSVFKHPNLTLETRVSERGEISYPLIGKVMVGDSTLEEAEIRIASSLAQGGYVKNPQVTLVLLQVRGNQVSVLGHVNRPGRFPLDSSTIKLSDVLAMAGGLSPTGSDVVIVTGEREGKPIRSLIDIPSVFVDQDTSQDILMAGGDVVYVAKAPVYYIYGQVQRPGVYRIERDMSVQQALAMAGGLNSRGTEKNLQLHRPMSEGRSSKVLNPSIYDPVQPNDVIYVRESIF